MTTRSAVSALGIVVTLLALGASTGCAADEAAGPTNGTREEAVTEQPPPESDATPSLPTIKQPTRPPSRPTDAFRKVRLVGTVVSEADAACVELEDDNGVRWTLLGVDPKDLATGRRVSVAGMPRPEALGCTGPPVAVQRLDPLD